MMVLHAVIIFHAVLREERGTSMQPAVMSAGLLVQLCMTPVFSSRTWLVRVGIQGVCSALAQGIFFAVLEFVSIACNGVIARWMNVSCTSCPSVVLCGNELLH